MFGNVEGTVGFAAKWLLLCPWSGGCHPVAAAALLSAHSPSANVDIPCAHPGIGYQIGHSPSQGHCRRHFRRRPHSSHPLPCFPCCSALRDQMLLVSNPWLVVVLVPGWSRLSLLEMPPNIRKHDPECIFHR